MDIPIDKEPLDNKKTNCVSKESQAVVTQVKVSGEELRYTFSVTVKSPDTGCDQYADWWEVISPDSVLFYRRILAHSHVTEQPFTRSGSFVEVNKNTQLIVRAHMNNSGYGCLVHSGNIEKGFNPDTLPTNYALSLADLAPLPAGCDF